MAGAGLCFLFKKYSQIFVLSTTQDCTKKKKISLRMNVLYNLRLFQIFPRVNFSTPNFVCWVGLGVLFICLVGWGFFFF